MNIGKKLLCGTITLCLLGQSLSGIPAVSAKTNAVKLNVSKKTIIVGKSFSLKLKGNVSSKAVVTWKSSKKKIAVVSKNGRVTGKKAGKAKIIVTVSGKKGKAVCKVTVQKKKSSSAKPAQTQAPASASPAPAAPTNTPPVTDTQAPSASPSPALKTADPSVLVVSQSLVERDGVAMTAYLINKNYSGNITVSLNGKSYTYNEKTTGKNLLVALVTLKYPDEPKTNQDGTISIYRGQNDEYWTVKDLELNKEYYLKAERTNTLDPSWADCGVIYVKGDVRSEVGFQTITQ